MPRKQYLQHLTEVSQASPDKSIESSFDVCYAGGTQSNQRDEIIGVRRGEDDGSFIISYKPPASSGLEDHIEITGLIPG